MAQNMAPTKGNLMTCKSSLALARQGYALMDKKRNVLIRELTGLIEEAKGIQAEIDQTFGEAYRALEKANIEHGIRFVSEIAETVPADDGIRLKYRSIMGTDIPLVEWEKTPPALRYAFYGTRESLDQAVLGFEKVKELTIRLSTVENSAYRLAANIRKTQKRANALKNITIPNYDRLVREIGNALEEKEREEFTRLKVIKRQKDSAEE